MDEKIRNLDVRDVEMDEIFGFVQKKEGHKLSHEKDVAEIGTAYCLVGMERNTKLVLCHHLGRRDAVATDKFVHKLSVATSHKKFQLTCDGFQPCPRAVQIFLPGRVHFATLVKVYGAPSEGEGRYSPAEVVDSVPTILTGNPVSSRICTSHIERQNLSIRMGMRRMTRLTNAFSKKWGNLQAAYSLWFAFYNFCCVHKSLRVTPAMESGLANDVWEIRRLLKWNSEL